MSKKDEIIDAAVKEFGRYSYDAASINRIIKSSGTSKGTFYHYFKDKKTLYFAIIESMIEIKQEFMSRMMIEVKNEGGDFFDMMKCQSKAAAVFINEYPQLFDFGIMFASEQGSIRKEVADKYINDIGGTVIELIKAGIANKSYTDRYPPEFIARIIWYMTMNYYDILFDKNDKPSMEDIEKGLEMMFDFLKRGFS